LSSSAFVLALAAGCGGSTVRETANPDAGTGSYGGAAGAAGSSGSGALGGDAGRGGAGDSAGVGGGAGSTGATGGNSGGGNAGGGNAGGDAGIGGSMSGSGGSTFGRGGSAGAADAGPFDTCSLPPDTGPCLAAMRRFHYDPAIARCREFTYGGCGGNLNNFMTLADCEAKCSHRADSCRYCGIDSCDTYGDCTLCPLNGEATGQGCGLRGLECNFGGCGPICRCDQDAAGLTWRCIALPC
jgi:hypothetical protein